MAVTGTEGYLDHGFLTGRHLTVRLVEIRGLSDLYSVRYSDMHLRCLRHHATNTVLWSSKGTGVPDRCSRSRSRAITQSGDLSD